MAFDRTDIDKLRDAVSGRYRAEGTGGGLSMNFSMTAGAQSAPAPLKGSEQKSIAEQTLFNLGVGFLNGDPDAAAPNFMLSGSAQTMREHALENSLHEKSEREEIDTALAQSREQLRRMLDELDAQLADIDAELERIRVRRVEIGNALSATQDVSDLIASGRFDPNDASQRDLCRRAGIEPEQLRGKGKDEQLDIIARRRGELTAEDDTLETAWNDKMAERGVIMKRRSDVQAALDDLNNADTDEAKLAAMHRAETISGVRALGGAAFESDNIDRKLIAADAVAENESDEAKAQSLVLNRSSIAQNGAEFFQTKSGNPSF